MKFLLKLGICVWSTWSKFQVIPLSTDNLAVLCSKSPPARKQPFFNEVTETAIFHDGEEHTFAAAKQSRLYRTFNAAQTIGVVLMKRQGDKKYVPTGLIAQLAAAYGCNLRTIRRIGVAF